MFKSKLALIVIGIISVVFVVGGYLALSGGGGYGYGESETGTETGYTDSYNGGY